MKNLLPNPDIALVSSQQLRLMQLIDQQLHLMAQQLTLLSHSQRNPVRPLAAPASSVAIPLPAVSGRPKVSSPQVVRNNGATRWLSEAKMDTVLPVLTATDANLPVAAPVSKVVADASPADGLAEVEKNQLTDEQAFDARNLLPVLFFEQDDSAAAPQPVANELAAGLSGAADSQPRQDAAQPDGLVEANLMDLFKDILGVSDLQVSDNFFQLGGNSLRAIQLLSRIYKTFQVKLTLPVLLGQASVAGLAALIESPDKRGYQTIPPPQSPDAAAEVVTPNVPDARILAGEVKQSDKSALPREYEIDLQQKGQWLLHKLREDGNPFNLQHVYPYQDFSIDAFTFALKTLVGRHESLRTTFAISEGILKHQVHAFDSLDFENCIGHAKLDEGMDNECFNRLMDEERKTPFNLDVWPLFRIKTFGKASETIVMFVIHHAIFDSTSLEIINNEMSSAYESYINKTDVDLPALPLQFRHVFGEKQAFMQGSLGAEAQQYWLQKMTAFKKDYMASVRPGISRESKDMPWLNEELTNRMILQNNTALIDKDLDILLKILPIFEADGGFYRLYLDYALIEELEQLATSNGNTLFILMLTSFSILQHLLSGKDHHMIALCASERESRNSNIIGWMVGSLCLALKANDDFSVQQRLGDIQNELLDAFKYRNYPFDKVLSDSDIAVAYNEIIPMFINYLEIDKEISNTATVHVNGQFCTQHDLNFTLRKYKNAYEMECIYNNSLFSADAIEDIFSNYIQLLRQIANNPQVKLSELQVRFQPELV